MKILKMIALLGTLAVLVGACSWITNIVDGEEQMGTMLPFTVDTEVSVTGTVTGTIDDCAFDGICALVLDVDGEEVNAIWAEGMLRCEGQYEDEIALGDEVEVYGIARDTNSLSICPSSSYYLRPVA